MATGPESVPSAISEAAIRDQLARILGSKTFQNSQRLSRFLRYTVEETLTREVGSLKEYFIGVRVFDRDESYDPGADPIVRVEARRLRAKLQAYYEREGRGDRILIEIPKPGYAPIIRQRQDAGATILPMSPLPPGPSLVESPAPQTRKPATIRHFRLWLLAAAAFALVALALSLWLQRPQSEKPELVLRRLTWDSGLTTNPDLSRDGRLLVYASDRAGEGSLDNWLQQIAGGEPLRVTRDPADDRQPAFSPDGTLIAFRSERQGGGIYIVSALGGQERRIVDGGRSPRFSPDGKWIAYWTGTASSRGLAFPGEGLIFVVPSAGGEPRRLAAEFASASYPAWLPDGKHLLFLGYANAEAKARVDFDWWVVSLESGSSEGTGALQLFRTSGLSFSPLEGSPGGWNVTGDSVLFSAALRDSHNLWRVRLPPNRFQLQDAPQQVTSGPGREGQPTTLSRDRFGFVSLQANADIWELPMGGGEMPIAREPRRIVGHAALDIQPSLSRDGKRLAFHRPKNEAGTVLLMDLASGLETSITPPGAKADFPILSKDGSKIAFRVIEGSKASIHVRAATGRVSEKICEECGIPTGWCSDNERILYTLSGSPSVFLWNVTTGEHSEWLQHPQYGLFRAQFSPDDRWIAVSARTGLCCRQVFIAPARKGPLRADEWIPLAEPSGWDDLPRWAPSGDLLYFVSDRDGFRCLWAQPLQRTSGLPHGPPHPVYHFHSARRSPMNLTARDEFDFSAASDRVVLALGEITGNLWLGEFRSH